MIQELRKAWGWDNPPSKIESFTLVRGLRAFWPTFHLLLIATLAFTQFIDECIRVFFGRKKLRILNI